MEDKNKFVSEQTKISYSRYLDSDPFLESLDYEDILILCDALGSEFEER